MWRYMTHTEMHFGNEIDEAPMRIESVPVNFESSSLVQVLFSDKEVQRPDSTPNILAKRRMSPPLSEPTPSQNKLDHANFQFDAQNVESFISSKPANLVTPKRARSPLISVEKPLHSSSVLFDSEREMQAKAKRLARFNKELTEPLQNLRDLPRDKPSGNRQNQVPLVLQIGDEHALDATYGGSVSDHEGSESSKAVMGLCPDMCPEMERDERERKGDLDKYERLNGDRNHTSKFLAVKKYNRMAGREAELIRPMHVLQKTVDYLLSLLDQPYDDNFLNIYNFLWDRMRGVRMDLRMQHIFNENAIHMLEQMIRLHVIAMHELCEFEKGEGFTEGFDAHLNIEQMNKTSVELFQLYDDHRKLGKSFASEREFRGYYALFKLDKHPGYKVEPVELSLDLAKMTPEIRSTPEILFARDVARACRIGNYIAFFRLARKATYLQACLMHAHFSKIRKQALASLHSGLQNNQGVPIAQVVKWLAVEGEDVENLVEYHGFSIKKYEETYMVKEGSFLNSDIDFPTECSLLVRHKRSRQIADDVKSSLILENLSAERECTTDDHINSNNTGIHLSSTPMVLNEPSSLFEELLPVIKNRESVMKLAEISSMMTPFMPSVEDVARKDDIQQIQHQHNDASFNGVTLQVFESNKNQPSSSCMMISENSTSKKSENGKLESKTLLPLFDEKKEILKLIIRKWKKQAVMRREKREQKEFLSSSALSSLSLGPPIGQNKSQKSMSYENLDIDAVARARLGNYDKSWSRLNISDLIAPIMAARNPSARFICWKLVLLVQPGDPDNQTHQLASDWLFFKLMGPNKEHDAELVVSSPGLSIWKQWSSPQSCCLSVIREKVLDDGPEIGEEDEDVLDGANCLVCLVSETIPWEIQRARLQNFLVSSITPGSDLPLLILSTDSSGGDVAARSLNIIRNLDLYDEEERRRICSSLVIFLRLKNFPGFFDEHQLRVGLQWLANNTRSAPLLCLVRTRRVVLEYLRRFMEAAAGFDVAPNDCIAGFNEALDKTAEEIVFTASMNPTRWPAPEIDLLEKSSNEGVLAASMCFPSAGWSSTTRIEALVSGIKSCKLVGFPDTSWLKHESLTGEQIKQQKLGLEKVLVSYLNESNKLLEADLAAREVSVMVQKCVGLQLGGSGYYYLNPRWILIFKRIYSWQLNKLTVPWISNIYLLDSNKDHLLSRRSSSSSTLSFDSSFGDVVCLDELVDIISCGNPQPLLTTRPTPSIDEELIGCSSSYQHTDVEHNTQIAAPLLITKNDRLSTLLERCNILQDMIDQKLTIYF